MLPEPTNPIFPPETRRSPVRSSLLMPSIKVAFLRRTSDELCGVYVLAKACPMFISSVSDLESDCGSQAIIAVADRRRGIRCFIFVFCAIYSRRSIETGVCFQGEVQFFEIFALWYFNGAERFQMVSQKLRIQKGETASIEMFNEVYKR